MINVKYTNCSSKFFLSFRAGRFQMNNFYSSMCEPVLVAVHVVITGP